MSNNYEKWLIRANAVLREQAPNRSSVPFAVSLLTALYGPNSSQLEAFNAHLAGIAKSASNLAAASSYQTSHADSTIANCVGEIENGLVGNLRSQIAGEILAELVSLAKETLEDRTDASKNVAAVLVAAAFEDLIRRMGNELAGVTGRPRLENIVNSLKDARVLQGGEVGTALSYLKFRNDSLHADWNLVDRPQIQSCIGFVEGLLLKHFS